MTRQTISADLAYCELLPMVEVHTALQKFQELYAQFLLDEFGTLQSKSRYKRHREFMRSVFGALNCSASFLAFCMPPREEYFGPTSSRPLWQLTGAVGTGEVPTSGLPFAAERVGTTATVFHRDSADLWTVPPPIPRPAPFLARTHVTALHAAIRHVFDGPRSVWELLQAWEHRYDVANNTAKADKRPRRQLSIDRTYQALMRFVFGFFGSHKVDARNNP